MTPLADGNYVVVSPTWENGAVTDAGAVTFGDGTVGTVGFVSAANSLVGTFAGEEVGSGANDYDGVSALRDGNYVVVSPDWDNGTLANAGAVTFGNGVTGTVGTINAANSALGISATTTKNTPAVTPDYANDQFYTTFLTASTAGRIRVGSLVDGFTPSGAIVYVSSSNFGLGAAPVPGQTIDGDQGTSGVQQADLGSRMPSPCSPAMRGGAFSIVASSGAVIVNAGTYAESPSLLGSETLRLSGGAGTLDSLDSVAGTTVDLQGNALTVGTSAGGDTIAGSIVGNGGSLTIAGSTALTLTGMDSYTGPTTVSSGSLIVNGSLSRSSTVSVTAAGALGGSGSVGAVISSGIVNPGTPGTPGTLTVAGNLTLGSGTLVLDLAASGSDSVNATGSTVNITGTTLSLNVGAITPNESFTILTVPGTSSGVLQGTFANLPNTGSSFSVGSLTFTINYAGGDGNDVVLTASGAVPTLVSTALNGELPYINNTAVGQQHSMVENIVYSFSQTVNLSTANFALTGINGTTSAPNVTLTSSPDRTMWTVTFTGAGVNTATGSIGDGEYDLALSGVPGLATNTFDFFRLLGDMDGNGVVNSADFSTFESTFLRGTSDPAYFGADDLDGNGKIDSADFSEFESNFLHSLPNTTLLH